MDRFTIKSAPFQANDVQTGKIGPVANHRSIRDHVAVNTGHAADHGVFADADKLMNGRQTANNGEILDQDMARQGSVIDQNTMVPDMTIVTNMGPGHQKAVIANCGFHPAAFRAGIKGGTFADFGTVANNQAALFTLELKVLRGMTDRGERIDFTFITKGCHARHCYMAVQFYPVPQDNLRADHAIGPDFDILTNLRAIFDDGGWMHF